jgi:hypothetical protein
VALVGKHRIDESRATGLRLRQCDLQQGRVPIAKIDVQGVATKTAFLLERAKEKE